MGGHAWEDEDEGSRIPSLGSRIMLRVIARSVGANICWNGSFEVNFDKQSLTIAPPSTETEPPVPPPLSEQDERNAMKIEDANVIHITMGHNKSWDQYSVYDTADVWTLKRVLAKCKKVAVQRLVCMSQDGQECSDHDVLVLSHLQAVTMKRVSLPPTRRRRCIDGQYPPHHLPARHIWTDRLFSQPNAGVIELEENEDAQTTVLEGGGCDKHPSSLSCCIQFVRVCHASTQTVCVPRAPLLVCSDTTCWNVSYPRLVSICQQTVCVPRAPLSVGSEEACWNVIYSGSNLHGVCHVRSLSGGGAQDSHDDDAELPMMTVTSLQKWMCPGCGQPECVHRNEDSHQVMKIKWMCPGCGQPNCSHKRNRSQSVEPLADNEGGKRSKVDDDSVALTSRTLIGGGRDASQDPRASEVGGLVKEAEQCVRLVPSPTQDDLPV